MAFLGDITGQDKKSAPDYATLLNELNQGINEGSKSGLMSGDSSANTPNIYGNVVNQLINKYGADIIGPFVQQATQRGDISGPGTSFLDKFMQAQANPLVAGLTAATFGTGMSALNAGTTVTEAGLPVLGSNPELAAAGLQGTITGVPEGVGMGSAIGTEAGLGTGIAGAGTAAATGAGVGAGTGVLSGVNTIADLATKYPMLLGMIASGAFAALSTSEQIKAINDAADKQSQSSDKALALQEKIYNDSKAMNQPFYDVATGVNPSTGKSPLQDFSLYQYNPTVPDVYKALNDVETSRFTENFNKRFATGHNPMSTAVQRLYGDQLQPLLASQTARDWQAATEAEKARYNALTDKVNVGRGAATQGIQSAQNFGTTAGNLYTTAGTNAANSATNQGQVYGSLYSGLGQLPWQYMAMNKLYA